MSNQVVTINIVVLNGEKYVRRCLDSVLAQTYPHNLIELNVLDNGSLDNTVNIIENFKFPKFNFIKSKLNLGMWPGQEKLLKDSTGEYVIFLSVDVILDKDFISNTVRAMSKDEKIGAVQAKIYSYNIEDIEKEGLSKKTIDTCGFQI
ncbi:MAG: glycosyltransferase, partial [Candidatus Levybacteria bacterium]|nr:glycosyltransferase [Candidatus Levybacteria bacterium]